MCFSEGRKHRIPEEGYDKEGREMEREKEEEKGKEGNAVHGSVGSGGGDDRFGGGGMEVRKEWKRGEEEQKG